jgi:hypothetical protein
MLVSVGAALMEGPMSTGEIGALVFIVSLFMSFAVVLAWASRHGG